MKKNIAVKELEALKMLYGENTLLALYKEIVVKDSKEFCLYCRTKQPGNRDLRKLALYNKMIENNHLSSCTQQEYNDHYSYFRGTATGELISLLTKYFQTKIEALSKEELMKFVLSSSIALRMLLNIKEESFYDDDCDDCDGEP